MFVKGQQVKITGTADKSQPVGADLKGQMLVVSQEGSPYQAGLYLVPAE